MFRRILYLLTALLAACVGNNPKPPAQAGPVFTINSPLEGSTIAGTVFFSAQPSDPSTVRSATFKAAGKDLGSDSTPADGLKVFLSAKDFPAGSLKLEATLTYKDGKTNTQTISVTNVPNPPSSATVGTSGAVLGTAEANGAVSTLRIPPGTSDGASVSFAARSKEQVKAATGIDYDALGVTFLGAQEIGSSKPIGTVPGVSSGGFGPMVQPGQAVVNYMIAPDADGDGVGELVVINTASVAPTGDVISDPLPKLTVDIAKSTVGQGLRPMSHGATSGPPGTLLQFHVVGFNPNSFGGNLAEWKCAGKPAFSIPGSVFPDPTNPSAQIFQTLIPLCPPGTASVTLRDISTGQSAGPFSITITAAAPVANPGGAIGGFAGQMGGFLGSLPATGNTQVDQAVDAAEQAAQQARERAEQGGNDATNQNSAPIANNPDVSGPAPSPGGVPCLTKDERSFLRKQRDAYSNMALASFPLDPNGDFSRALAYSRLAHLLDQILSLYPKCDEEPKPPCRPTIGGGGSGTTGMGSAPPPGGPGCGNVNPPPPPSPSGLKANALSDQQPGRVVVKILVGSQVIPFSGATDAGGYFYIPFIPEGQPFTAIARDTQSGQSRVTQGVGPATGQSVQMFFDFGSDPGKGSISGLLNSGGNPVVNATVRALLQASNALSSVAEARTGSDGRYTLPKLPDGSYTLEVRSLNHARTTRSISLSNANPVVADFSLNALTPFHPAKVYVLSSGNTGGDDAVMEVLRLGGHQPTLGVPFVSFDGSQANLAAYDAVLLLNNYNWNSGFIPAAGANALIAYVNGGGGLVTCEWLVWNLATRLQSPALYAILPVTGGPFNGATATTYTRATANATIDRDLPVSFSFSLGNLSGSESFFTLKSGSTAFYGSSNASGKPGLAGWDYAQGRVASFSTLMTETELSSFEYQQLVTNAVSWVAKRGN